MQISSRFTVALHIFTCVDTFKDEYKVTSDFLAGYHSKNTHTAAKYRAYHSSKRNRWNLANNSAVGYILL